jgi:lysozyme family protein
MNFDDAFETLIGHEGVYSNDPVDPGGETKYGISKRAYPGEDIKAMTLDRAKAIYRTDYWGPAGCDAVPDGVRFDLFDMSVNSGVRAAVKTLQRAVGEAHDGVLGPKTLQAIGSMPAARLVARFNGWRIVYITAQPDVWWNRFGKGLMNRIAANLRSA